MTDIQIYDTEAERLNEAAAKVGESVATVIEWLVEEFLDDTVDDVLGKPKRGAECKFCVNQKTNDYGTYGKCLLQDKRIDCLVWSRDTNCPLAESEEI